MISTIDLFAGAGGIGIGVCAAGGKLVLSMEIDNLCCETLALNSEAHSGKILNGDVDDITGQELRDYAGISRNDPLVIVGGPPCQPFSKASYWTDPGDDSKYRQARMQGLEMAKPSPITKAKRDERRDLVNSFLDRVIEADADGFMFENVTSILHPRNKNIVDRFLAKAKRHGYKCTLIKANAAEYGVPQIRQRVFILAAKSEQPTIPPPTHTDPTKKMSRQNHLLQYTTAGSAISSFSGDMFFEPEEIIVGKWANELKEVPPGMNYKALSAWAGHPNPVFVAETRFWNFLLKLSPEKPSWTIAATPGPWTGPFHWNNRRLRTVEMAALQTFPTGYNFTGNRRERVKQIGNAAPPQLVKCMLGEVYKAIK